MKFSTAFLFLKNVAYDPLIHNFPTLAAVQATVVQKMDIPIHRINHYPVDSIVCFVNIAMGTDDCHWSV